MTAAAILENGKIAISLQHLTDFDKINMVTRIGNPCAGDHLKSQFNNPTWRTAAILEIEKSPYLSNGLWRRLSQHSLALLLRTHSAWLVAVYTAL